MDFELVTADADDQPFLEQLFAEVHAPGLVPLQLPAQALQQLLAMQFRAQSLGYVAGFPAAVDQIVRVKGQRAGRLLIDRSQTVMHLLDIALLTPYRGEGIGTRLLRDLCAEAEAHSVPLQLSVRFDNPAIRLYERFGFLRTGGDGLNTTMALHATAPQPDRAVAVPPEDDLPVEQAFSSRYFRSLVGEVAAAQGIDRTRVNLKVVSVTKLNSGSEGSSGGRSNEPDSFVIDFSGPLEPILPSATAQVTPTGGESMDIFLSPLGPRDGSMRYEAVFIRMPDNEPA